jgi:hypothetical protein
LPVVLATHHQRHQVKETTAVLVRLLHLLMVQAVAAELVLLGEAEYLQLLVMVVLVCHQL